MNNGQINDFTHKLRADLDKLARKLEPILVTITHGTVISNVNADMLDGFHAGELMTNPLRIAGDTLYLPDTWATVKAHESSGAPVEIMMGGELTPTPPKIIDQLSVAAVDVVSASPAHIDVSFWYSFVENYNVWAVWDVKLRRDSLTGHVLATQGIASSQNSEENNATGHAYNLTFSIDDPSPTTYAYVVTIAQTGAYSQDVHLYSNERDITVYYRTSVEIRPARLPIGTVGQVLTVAAGLPAWAANAAVPTARTISTTAPLTGGGDLSANRTLAIPAATATVDGYATSTQIAKLDGIAAGAEVNVNADWNASSGDALISNKPTLGTAAAKNIPATGDASATEVVYGSDTRLANSRTPSAHAATHVTGGADVIASAIAAGNAGLMTGEDKTKLDGMFAVENIMAIARGWLL